MSIKKKGGEDVSKREIKKWHVSRFSPRHRGVTRRREEEGEMAERYVEQKDREVKGVFEKKKMFRGTCNLVLHWRRR